MRAIYIYICLILTILIKSESNPAVEAGRRQMLAGTIKGFFSIHEIILTKEEQEEYGL